MNHRPEIRRLAEEREESLSPYARKSRLSQGRLSEEKPCPIRTAFQRDRDRIIHSNSFRRLKHKTQVFIAPLGDHYVTRLTHTLEVSQIARTIARALNLNEDLAEAISLGHDLGHTPFGHLGEEVLNDLYPGGFHHNEQSLRVVDHIENNSRGLNLTWEVRDGILNHSKTGEGILKDEQGKAGTCEGEICRLADIIAYVNHDTDDAIRAGIITGRELPLSAVEVLGLSRSARINTLVTDIINHSWAITGNSAGVEPYIGIGMSPEVLEATNILRVFLFERVYTVQAARVQSEKARDVIRLLYEYFVSHQDRLPPEYHLRDDDKGQRVVDYIAGMTDQYAMRKIEELALPESKVRQLRFIINRE